MYNMITYELIRRGLIATIQREYYINVIYFLLGLCQPNMAI